MKFFLIALTTIAVLTTQASAQGRGRGGKGAKPGQQSEQRTAEQKKREADAEKAYKAALDKIPNKKSDPWENMR
jgi:hypothetical protein